MRSLVVALALVAGCKSDPLKEDNDGDGFIARTDCDDGDPNANPAGAELCDGVDNDCDGQVDENLGEEVFADADGDGFGDPDETTLACADVPAGYSEDDTDCDDTDPAAYPGAPEDCAAPDRNCDGDPIGQAADIVTWGRDADGDGYGDSVQTAQACEVPSGYAASTDDCDDTRDTVNPGATEAGSCDGVDTDCDGAAHPDELDADADTVSVCDGDCDDADEDVFPGATEICNGGTDDDCDPATAEDVVDGVVWYSDSDGDQFGLDSVTVNACVQPANHAAAGGDCDDGDPDANPGEVEVCGGVDEDCDGQQDVGAVDATDWFDDADNDTFGGTSLGAACVQPPGATADGSDCDDNAPTIFVGAPEVCDGADSDCDTIVPANEADVDGDGSYVCAGDCDDNVDTTFPGAVELCNAGIDDDCDPSTDEQFTAQWWDDQDGNLVGNDAITYFGCSPPAGYVQVPGDCDDTDPTINVGACVIDHCGPITADETWSSTATHRVTCDVTVGGPLRPELVVVGGAVVEFDPGTALIVGPSGSDGSLRVTGALQPVSFTSTTGTPGDWEGVTLGPDDQGSVIQGLVLEYGGGNGDGGLVIDGASPLVDGATFRENLGDGIHVAGGLPTIRNSTIESNVSNGVFIESAGGLSRGGAGEDTFTNNFVAANGNRPMVLPGGFADELSPTSTFLGNADNVIELTAGVAQFSGTWYLHDATYEVSGNVAVAGPTRPRIAIEDGVVIAFDNARGLDVGVADAGSLAVSANVTFTTSDPLALPGRWLGVTFGQNDDGSTITGLVVEYGGGNGDGAIELDGSGPVFDQIVVRDSGTAGLYGRGASPSITGSTFEDNLEEGVFLDANSTLAASFVGNTSTGNQETPVTLPANSAHRLDPSSTYAGNVVDRVVLLGGTTAGLLDASRTWRLLDVDYRLDGDVDVEGPLSPALTLENGVTLEMMPAVEIRIGDGERGRLVVQGGVSGVLFTSAQTAKAPGQWDGLKLGSLDQNSALTGLTIEYAGGNNRGGLFVDGATSLIDGVVSRNNLYSGLSGEDCIVEIRNSLFEGNTDEGVELDRECRLATGGSSLVRTFANNVLVANGTWPLVVNVVSVSELDTSSAYGGNGVDRVRLIGDTTTQDATVVDLPDAEYELASFDWLVQGPLQPILTVEAGVELSVGADLGLLVGDANFGRLIVSGTPLSGVLFTSVEPLPLPGDWDGLKIGGFDTGSILDYLTVEYAGANQRGGIWSVDSGPVITGGELRFNEDAGFYGDGSFAVLDGVVVTGNTGDGVFFDTDSAPLSFQNVTIDANAGTAIVIPAARADELDTTSVYVGNGADEVVLTADTVDFPVLWRDLGVPYRVADGASVAVQGGPSAILTIEDDVEVRFGTGSDLAVAASLAGRLVVDGQTNGVRFTSRYLVQTRGDWQGLSIGPGDQASSIVGLTIEYGGNGQAGQITIASANPTLDGVVCRESTSNCLDISGTALPTITDSEFLDSDEHGIDIASTAGLSELNQPSFRRNDIHGNGQSPIKLPANAVGQMQTGTNSVNGNGLPIEITGGDVLRTQEWPALDEVYVVSADIDVGGPLDPILTIDDGVELYFDQGLGFKAGRTDDGSLVINGFGAGVIMSSTSVLPGPGIWAGIEIGIHNQVSSILGLLVEYGGDSNPGLGGNIEIYDSFSNVAMIDVESRFSSKYGIYAVGTPSAPCRISLVNSVIHDNTDGGLYADPDVQVTSAFGNVFFNNGLRDLVGPPDAIEQMTTLSTWNSSVIVLPGSLTVDSNWGPTPAGYVISGDLDVFAALTIAAGEVLFVDDGVEIEVASTAVGGSLVADNVTFTSNSGAPFSGIWDGLVVNDLCNPALTSFDGTVFEYGGGNGVANYYDDRCGATLANASSSFSGSFGIASNGNGDPPPSWSVGTLTFFSNALGNADIVP